MIAIARCRVRVVGPASGRASSGCGGGGRGVRGCRAWFGRAARRGPGQVGDGVVYVDGSADGGGVGEHISRVAELELFAEAGGDFIGVDWGVPGGQVDDRFQVDGAVVAEQQPEPVEQYRADVFDAGHTGAGGEGFGAEVHIDHCAGPGPFWPERRRQDLQ